MLICFEFLLCYLFFVEPYALPMIMRLYLPCTGVRAQLHCSVIGCFQAPCLGDTVGGGGLWKQWKQSDAVAFCLFIGTRHNYGEKKTTVDWWARLIL